MYRNKGPILEVLKTYIPSNDSLSGHMILEVASGTGQHASYFASSFPNLRWQPTELTRDTFDSIEAWTGDAPNISQPILLDCIAPVEKWGVPPASCAVVLCINMIHISPWCATQGLFSGSGKVLLPQGRLIVYGPFKVEGKATTESNAAFDRDLRARNAAWGLRDVADLDAESSAAGLKRVGMLPMPANNFCLIYERA